MNNVELFVTTKNNLTSKRGKYEVCLINDESNSFDYVINALQEVCGHSYIQAGQCATITHNIGICSIFIDTYDECEDVFKELLVIGMRAELHKYKPISHDKGNKKTNN